GGGGPESLKRAAGMIHARRGGQAGLAGLIAFRQRTAGRFDFRWGRGRSGLRIQGIFTTVFARLGRVVRHAGGHGSQGSGFLHRFGGRVVGAGRESRATVRSTVSSIGCPRGVVGRGSGRRGGRIFATRHVGLQV